MLSAASWRPSSTALSPAGSADRGLAEEITQDVFFLQVWQHAEHYDPARGEVRTWIYGIARNAIIDAERRRVPRAGSPMSKRWGGADRARPAPLADHARLRSTDAGASRHRAPHPAAGTQTARDR